MSSSNFLIKTHTFPGQHLREYAGATRDREEDVLYLEAKQYIPLDNLQPRDGDITVLATHGLGFPKELYEPLWDDLLAATKQHGFRIRSIWIADASNQGASGVMNERVQGDEPSFFDYPRDLLHMISLFRSEFTQPIVGIGHSMGGAALVQLSILHPRLLASLVLFDPVIGVSVGPGFASMFYGNSIRPDLWQSRKEAGQQCQKLYRTWDPRAFQLWLQHGLRDTPTLLYPDAGKVTLRSTKAQEAWAYGRSWFDPLPSDGNLATPRTRGKYPDQNDSVRVIHPFYRAEDIHIWNDLPQLRPGVLYVFPAKGPMTDGESVNGKIERTGTGPGGSGGAREGKVARATIEDVGHLLPFEKPKECAASAAEWLGRDLIAWRERIKYAAKHRDDRSIDKLALSDEWIRQVKRFYHNTKRGGQAKL